MYQCTLLLEVGGKHMHGEALFREDAWQGGGFLGAGFKSRGCCSQQEAFSFTLFTGFSLLTFVNLMSFGIEITSLSARSSLRALSFNSL